MSIKSEPVVGVSYPNPTSRSALHTPSIDHVSMITLCHSLWSWFIKVARNRTGANLLEKGPLGTYAHVLV